MRLLVVSNVADTLVEILRLRGYDAISARDVEEALALSPRLYPEAVLTEVISQRMDDGLPDANRLGEAFPACKVILFSKNVQKASRFLRSGANDYRFPLVRRPQYPEDIPPFIAAVDAILLPSSAREST